MSNISSRKMLSGRFRKVAASSSIDEEGDDPPASKIAEQWEPSVTPKLAASALSRV